MSDNVVELFKPEPTISVRVLFAGLASILLMDDDFQGLDEVFESLDKQGVTSDQIRAFLGLMAEPSRWIRQEFDQ